MLKIQIFHSEFPPSLLKGKRYNFPVQCAAGDSVANLKLLSMNCYNRNALVEMPTAALMNGERWEAGRSRPKAREN